MNEDDTMLIPDNDIPPLADHERGRTTVPRVIQSVGLTRAFAAGGERGKTRACDADRERVVEFLNVAYGEGRLSRDEFDDRLDSAFSARTYADLEQILTDLPAAREGVVPPVSKINGLAIASVACGLGQFVFGPLATIPAIVFGHVARYQIKRTREQGAGLALAGLILGWATVILAVVLILVVGLAMSAGMHGTMH
jgi:type IV secretory pathway VirB2 component (pilin)